MLPWVVLSQTVPLIAIAPLVRRWGAQIQIGGFEWDSQDSVAVIAAYLAFFPVAVGHAARAQVARRDPPGPDAHATASAGGRRCCGCGCPASVPYLLPALRLAAAAAVIGTVVAEVSIGLRGGIGRLVIEYAQAAGGDPAKPWAPIFGAVAGRPGRRRLRRRCSALVPAAATGERRSPHDAIRRPGIGTAASPRCDVRGRRPDLHRPAGHA